MQDDKDQFDDFDDLGDFDDLDDLGDDVALGDDSSDEGFVDGGDDFSDEEFAGDAFSDDLDDDDFDEILGDDEEGDDSDAVNPALVSQDKEGFLSKFSFNQIVIGVTMIAGLGIFGYQVATKKPPPKQENFQSAVSMSGASDNVVYGQNGEVVNASDSSEGEQLPGLLNNTESLDSLEIEFEEKAAPVAPTVLDQEEDNNEKILLDKDLGNDFSEFENEFSDNAYEQSVMIAPEFDTSELPASLTMNQKDEPVLQEDEATTPTGAGSEITKVLPLKRDVTTEAVQNEIVTTSNSGEIQETEEAVLGLKVDSIMDDEMPSMPVVEETSQVEEISDMSEAAKEIAIKTEEIVDLSAPLKEEIAAKNKKIASLQSKVADLEKEIESLKAAKAKSPEPKTEVKKSTPKKKTTSKSTGSKNMWELRAAQPGKAWVAQKGRDELQPVVVGDILSGIGRIQDIAYRDNRWIVVGSQGQIKQ